jgi:lipoprotein NlpI
MLVGLGRFSGAIQDLVHAVTLDPRDAYSVLWLHIARLRANIDDARDFTIRVGALDGTKWPGPIVDFYEGKRTPTQVQEAAKNDGQRCEAHFYNAELQLAIRHAAIGRKELRIAAKTCPEEYIGL